MENDVYKTILKPSQEALFKDRGSKFYGFAFPVKTEAQALACVEELKQQHHKARHWCYAYQLGKSYSQWRANDDGEPSNSAGMPIYGQLQSFEVTNIVVIVVRYFGGTKLGVGGLINAYRSAAQLALQNCEFIKRTIDIQYTVVCEYPDLNKVMRIIKEHDLHVIDQDLALNCTFTISVRENEADKVFDIFNAVYGVSIKLLDH